MREGDSLQVFLDSMVKINENPGRWFRATPYLLYNCLPKVSTKILIFEVSSGDHINP